MDTTPNQGEEKSGGFSRRTFLRGVTSATGAIATGNVPGLDALVLPTAVQSAQSVIQGLSKIKSLVMPVLFGMPHFAKGGGFSDLVFGFGVADGTSADEVEKALLHYVSQQVLWRGRNSGRLNDELRSFAREADGPAILQTACEDAHVYRQSTNRLWETHAPLALKIIAESRAINPDAHSGRKRDSLSRDWCTLVREDQAAVDAALQKGDLLSLIRGSGLEEARVTPVMLFAYKALGLAYGSDLAAPFLSAQQVQEMLAARELHDTLYDTLSTKYQLEPARLAVIASAVEQFFCPTEAAGSFAVERCGEQVAANLHTTLLRLREDALERYRQVAKPRGRWLSPAHEEAYARLPHSLDTMIHNLANTIMRESFPDYAQADHLRSRSIDEELKKRADRAERSRVHLIPWPGFDGPGNDYY